MKILLISANRERSPYPVFPIGLAYLAGPLAAAGHDLAVLDLCFETDVERAVTAKLSEITPELTVISLRNIDNVTWPASRSYLEGVKTVVTACRQNSRVVVGGSGFSLMPQALMEYLGADFGVVGEGESLLPLLLERLSGGLSPHGLPGLLIKDYTDFVPPAPLERIGNPDRSLFDVARYQREGGMANVQTKRGCPFCCVYCTYPLLEGRSMRLRPVADIVAEVRQLVEQLAVSYIYFVDDIFNYPVAFAEELCRALIAARLPVSWTAFINPAFMTPELLDLMLAAGCDAIEYGTESGSPQMLRTLGKSFTVAQVRDASLLCRQRGVDFAHYILFGGPGETRATVLETFALMDELQPTAVITMTGIRIYPGTSIYQTALCEGLIDPATNLLEPHFYIAGEVKDILADLVVSEALKRTNWVVPGLEVNISDAMLEAMRMFPVQGPLWKMVKRMGRSRLKPV